MYEIDVRCRDCEEVSTINCDASGIAPGITMQCAACGRSAPHDPVSEPRKQTDSSPLEEAVAAVDDELQRQQSSAFANGDQTRDSWSVEQRSVTGGRPSGQTRLDGGIARSPGGGHDV
ncbi:hypothetical protein GWK26_12820 [haloarchaeon 3A1-DGR]|nr:hypothetical protein GWK26_12820 [haloarchaeon 3A1-DGR]